MSASFVARLTAPRRRLDLIAAALSIASLGAVLVGALDPSAWRSPSAIHSPFRALTGLPDPFCGLTHSLLALGQGRLVDSLDLNPLGPLVAVAAVTILVSATRALRRGTAIRWPRRCVPIGIAVIAAAWAIQLTRALA